VTEPTDPPPDRPAESAPISEQARARHWRRTLAWTGLLLALWFVVSFGFTFFARSLHVSLFGWPVSFWIAAQGALVVYLLIVAGYAWQMGRMEQRLTDREPR
jgi:putative solute:sodium symporter small subunit